MAETEQRQHDPSQYRNVNGAASNRHDDAEHPNLQLSSEERRYFGALFSAADTDKIGVITGEVAVKFFEKTKLPPATLGEVCPIGGSYVLKQVVVTES